MIDGTGYYQTSDALEYLASRGVRTTAIAHGPELVPTIDPFERPLLLRELRLRGADFRVSTLVEKIGEDSVELLDTLSGERLTLSGVDAVVIVLGADVEDGLYQALRNFDGALHRVGDCHTPRGIEHAIHDAHALARAL